MQAQPWAHAVEPAHVVGVYTNDVEIVGAPAEPLDVGALCPNARGLYMRDCATFPFTNVPSTVRTVRVEFTSEGPPAVGLVDFINAQIPKSIADVHFEGPRIDALDGLELGEANTVSVNGCPDLGSVSFGPGTTAIRTLYVSDCVRLAAMPDISRIARVQSVCLNNMPALTGVPMSRMPIGGVSSLYIEGCERFNFLAEDKQLRVHPGAFRLKIRGCDGLTRVPEIPTRVCSLLCENVEELRAIDTGKTVAFVDFCVMNAPNFGVTQTINVCRNSYVGFYGRTRVTRMDFMNYVQPFFRETVPANTVARQIPGAPSANGVFVLHEGVNHLDMRAELELKHARQLAMARLLAEQEPGSPLGLRGMQDMLALVNEMLEPTDPPVVASRYLPPPIRRMQ